ncbi:MAG TPA: glucosamine-6-phosphate deaminase [Chthoniobacteraceae bacterium]|nr:glucosamine-6-phosphate deaminase [Chthoniobacteraceae bacterium]
MPIKTEISPDKVIAGKAAAVHGARLIREAIEKNGRANIIVATGASQFEMLKALIEEDLPWEKITGFHLDEYVGMPITHPASFRGYLWERFHRQLNRPLRAFHYVAGDEDPQAECDRLDALIKEHPIDVCFAGIGENAHLAFNDPPANFDTEAAYLVVDLDEACRKQQLGEGWFATLDDVPKQAISMSIRQICKSKAIILSVPDARKAQAVAGSLQGPVTNMVPSSILQNHPDTTIYLDPDSASLLK